jgi:hypothetical protein
MKAGLLPKRILLTAFEPFGGDPVNPSLLIARALGGQMVEGAQVVAVELPCVFHRALAALDEALQRTQPVLAVAARYDQVGAQLLGKFADSQRVRLKLAGLTAEHCLGSAEPNLECPNL